MEHLELFFKSIFVDNYGVCLLPWDVFLLGGIKKVVQRLVGRCRYFRIDRDGPFELALGSIHTTARGLELVRRRICRVRFELFVFHFVHCDHRYNGTTGRNRR